MIENERYPLFDNAKDTYKSALQYLDLLKDCNEEELIKKFGCTWEDYVPKICPKKENENPIEK